MNLTCVKIEGGLLGPDFLEQIPEAEGQKPSDFGLPNNRTLVDEVSAVWSDVRSYWDAFQRRLQRQSSESLTSITREQWVIPLLETLGYELQFQRPADAIDGRRYNISHRAGGEDGPPVHIERYDQELGERPASGRGTASPHAMIQDYLNRSEDLWAVVTNGRTLRLLRDSSYFTRPSYIEFDLEQMLEGERLDEFFVFYRLVHRSRLPVKTEDGPDSLLERYHQLGIEQGGRIRDGLRDAVEHSLVQLGNGFLSHPKNQKLRDEIREGRLTADHFYQELLYTIYRLLFLMVAEERNMLAVRDGEEHPARRFFRISRLRDLSDEPLSSPERFDDLYLGMRTLFHILQNEKQCERLGLPPLNGELFSDTKTRHLSAAHLNNRVLLQAINTLSYFTPADEKIRRRVNYGALDVEELGSVYESLLEFQPVVSTDGTFEFAFVQGTERKSTGSYYTRPELVQELIKSALIPVMEDRLAAVPPSPREEASSAAAREDALLSLTVCDPACGSGHFLLAAARRIGAELARVRTGEEAPAPDAVRDATRDVITHCIYGVDKNPLAVDLCKVALWIEGHHGEKPLTFLDHRIRCGDSLVGVFELGVLQQPIPSNAYDAVTGDDPNVSKAMKVRNDKEAGGQASLPMESEAELQELAEERAVLRTFSDDTPADVQRKREAFERLESEGSKLWHDRLACNIWTTAFFAELTQENRDNGLIPTTHDLQRLLRDPGNVNAQLVGYVTDLAERLRFFHWPLAFPEVIGDGGFDVVLSNPPWDELQPEEVAFFESMNAVEIAELKGRKRKDAIAELEEERPKLYDAWTEHQRTIYASAKFMRESLRYPLTARGKLNNYPLFAGLCRALISGCGRTGVVLPTGIATNLSTSDFFDDLISRSSLVSLFDFQNSEGLFASVAAVQQFCLLTISGAGVDTASFAFFLTHPRELQDRKRRFRFSPEDMIRLNPNTRNCPVFRTRTDAELSWQILSGNPILINETDGSNPWNLSLRQGLFNITTASGLFFRTEEVEAAESEAATNPTVSPSRRLLPLYEAKFIHQFDHRFGSYEGIPVEGRYATRAGTHRVTSRQKADATYGITPRYWVEEAEVLKVMPDGWDRQWLIAFRKTAQMMTNRRCAMFAVLPIAGVADKAPIAMPDNAGGAPTICCFISMANSLVFDYCLRQKLGGASIGHYVLSQLPMPSPEDIGEQRDGFTAMRVVELTYTAWDIKAFADDVWREADDELREAIRRQWEENREATGGHEWDPPEWAEIAEDGCPLPPFKWDEDRRAVLRAELDAYYAKLYGLNRKQLRYILDPHGLSEAELEDILDPWEDPTCSGPHLLPAEPAVDFPGETFRVLKNKEEKQFGEYRTRRLVLAAWERLESGDL